MQPLLTAANMAVLALGVIAMLVGVVRIAARVPGPALRDPALVLMGISSCVVGALWLYS